MVYVRDDGVFEASIDKVWKYLQSPEIHRHDSILSQTVMDQEGNTLKIRAEVKGPQGKEEQMWRMTVDPPFGFELEVLSGSQKGSTNTHTYVPMGDKTKVIVVGNFNVEGLDDDATKRAMLDYFAKVFEEDNQAIQRL
jgi:hypothetical protein